MATGPVSEVLGWLNTRKGAGIACATIIGVAALLAIGRSHDAPNAAPGIADAAPPAIVTQNFSVPQVQAIREIVKDYLLQNPEIMVEISKELEKRQQVAQATEHKRLISENKSQIFKAPADFVLGNPKADVTVVEFFDYNCGWCKRAVDDVAKLTQSDPKIRVIMKEFPIFGENSTFAAKAAMASINQGKYWDFHIAMMREKQVTKENVFSIAQQVGINIDKLKVDMEDPKLDAALAENHKVAQMLAIEGTPGFIVDDRVNVGYVPVDGLNQIIADVRKTGCQVC